MRKRFNYLAMVFVNERQLVRQFMRRKFMSKNFATSLKKSKREQKRDSELHTQPGNQRK